MKISKLTIKKIIGYLSSILVLVFLGEDFLADGVQALGLFTGAQ